MIYYLYSFASDLILARPSPGQYLDINNKLILKAPDTESKYLSIEVEMDITIIVG